MEARAATAGMVATLRLRQLQDDVCDSEQAELRRLEGGVMDGDDSETDSDDSEEGQLVPDRVEEGADRVDGQLHEQDGVVVHGAVHRAEQLESKMFAHGGFRNSQKIIGLQPRGGAGLKTKVPKRKDFGAAGDEGDAAHSTAMWR